MIFLLDSQSGGSLRARSDVPVADTWDLSHLYGSKEAWEEDFRCYETLFPRYQEFQGRLALPGVLAEFLEFDQRCDRLVEKLYHYASLRTSEDASDNQNLKREGRLFQMISRAAGLSAFFMPELHSVEERIFEGWLADLALKDWHVWLKKIRRFKNHVLSEPEERLLAQAALPLAAAEDAFSQLNNVDLSFGTLTDEKGATVHLTHGAYNSFMVKTDRALRRQAFHQYYAGFSAHRYTLASTLAHSVKNDVFQARVRRHPSAVEKALFTDRIPLDVYHQLIQTVRSHRATVDAYYRLRRKVLKLDELHAFDTYVPMVGDFRVNTTFDRACELVVEAVAPLGDEYTAVLRRGFDSRWVDRYETKGKRSGAFSSSSYGHPPYMLMNYKEDVFSDVYTLAHEAGHSMHSWYAQGHQPFQYYQYPIFLAEVASTFNEELLTHHLLETTEDPRMRAYIINRQIDDIRSTLIRQTQFAEFELRIHEAEESGDALTLDTFTAIYHELLQAYHGSELVLDAELDLECLRIPHFYNAFYVYKYATGISAAIALAQKVLSREPGAVDAYLGFLKSGGREYPLETLQAAGVDLSTPAPVDAALTLFRSRVEQLDQELARLE